MSEQAIMDILLEYHPPLSIDEVIQITKQITALIPKSASERSRIKRPRKIGRGIKRVLKSSP